ncbi:O-antigen polymerase [Bifidobacterium ruminantium]|uniref:O-antigen polymerase n=1 Tax=Bifidobacterium ruminantium TaxID=78346 RepID=UPI002491310A|nr:O-antigen polymerase [Bifidobacterium ruminantium]
MISVALLFTLLFLLVLLLLMYRGDFAEPSVLFVLGFILSTFNGLTNYQAWNFNLSLQTYVVVVIGALLFLVTSYAVKSSFHAVMFGRKRSREYKKPRNITLPLWVYIAGLLFTCLSLLIVSRHVIAVTLPYGGNGSLSQAIGLYDKVNKFSTKSVGISGLASLMCLSVNAMAYVWLFLAMRSFVIQTLKKDYLALVNALATVPMTLMLGGRNTLIQLGVAIFTYWLLFRRQNNNWKSTRLRFRTVAWCIVVIAISLISFKPLLSLMGRKTDATSTYEYLSIYIGASLKNLDAFLTNSMNPALAVGPTQWGDMTLASTRASFPQLFGKTTIDWMRWQPFQRYNGEELGNVFTTYYAFIFDWGFIGAMVAIVLIAALSQLCYENVVYALQYGTSGVPLSMMLYGAIGYCCAFSFFSNRWFSTMFNQIMLKDIVIWIALIVFIKIVCNQNFGTKKAKRLEWE